MLRSVSHVRGVACPLGDLGGCYPGVEPGRHGGVPEVVRSPGDQGFGLGECLGAGPVKDGEVSPVGDNSAVRQGEDAPAGTGAELGEVVAEYLHKFRVNRDRPCFILCAVLEFAALPDAAVGCIFLRGVILR
jgi:hypothetical protein